MDDASICCISSDEWPDPSGESRNTVELSEEPRGRSYWEEIKGSGCKYYRNAVSRRHLGETPEKHSRRMKRNGAFY